MDTRALGGDFFSPRAEIFAVEMKTVTQYTALIRITAQMEQKGIPDLKGKKRRKGSLDQALVSITYRLFKRALAQKSCATL